MRSGRQPFVQETKSGSALNYLTSFSFMTWHKRKATSFLAMIWVRAHVGSHDGKALALGWHSS
jgi:hypothetical protein